MPMLLVTLPQYSVTRTRRAAFADLVPPARLRGRQRGLNRPSFGCASLAEPASEPPAQKERLVATAEPYITHSWEWRGHKINYTETGEGPAILLVHGFGASIGHYKKNIPFLAQSRKVFALDLLGFGSSDKPLLTYSLDLWRDLLLDFHAVHIASPTVLVGNSMGSLICLLVNEAASPGIVSGMCLLNCAGGMNSKSLGDDWRIKLAAPAFMLVDFLLRQQRIARYLFDKFRAKENIRAVLKGVYIDPEAVDDDLVDLIHTPSSADGAFEAFVSVLTGDPGPRPETFIDRVTGPLLLLWGDRDTFIPMDGPVGKFFQKLPATRPDTRFITLPNVGHCPQDDAPLLVNESLASWLEEYRI